MVTYLPYSQRQSGGLLLPCLTVLPQRRDDLIFANVI
jgi:hypothetical protein